LQMKFILVSLVLILFAGATLADTYDYIQRLQFKREGLTVHVSFFALNKEWKMNLHSNPNFDHLETVEIGSGGEIRSPIENIWYHGSLEDDPAAKLSLTATFKVAQPISEGVISTSTGPIYWLDSAANYFGNTSLIGLVLHTLAHERLKDLGLKCKGTPFHAQAQMTEEEATQRKLLQETKDPTRPGFPSLAVFADYYYYNRYTSNTSTRILSIISNINTIYSGSGLKSFTLKPNSVTIFTDATKNPGGAATASETILDGLKTYHASVLDKTASADLFHMWVGKKFDGSTVGLAYTSAACNLALAIDNNWSNFKDYGAVGSGISQDLQDTQFTSGQRAILTAHELGHNLGSDHVSTSTANNIMYPSVVNVPLDKARFITAEKIQMARSCKYYVDANRYVKLNDFYT